MTTTEVEHRSTGWVADDSAFGARLALVRQRMGWGNVKEAAEACNIPVQSWRSWERDNVKPRDVFDRARQIAERTGCDYGWLLDGPRLRGAGVHTQDRVTAEPPGYVEDLAITDGGAR